MRDDHIFVKSSDHNVDLHLYSGAVWPWVRSHVDGRTTNTYRSEGVPTERSAGGSYLNATNYEAFFSFTTLNDYSYWIDEPLKARKFHHFGQSSVGDSGAFLDTYGCLNSRPHIPTLPSGFVAGVESRVLSAIRGSEMNLGQTLGELPEAIEHVASTLLAAGRLFKAIKNRNVGRANEVIREYFTRSGGKVPSLPSRILKPAAGAFLQYQYAWKPMMNDIYNVCKLKSDGMQVSDATFIAINKTDDSYRPPSSFYNGQNAVVSGTAKRGCEVGVSFGITSQTKFDLNRLGLVNPYALAWELMPLSFVIDWFFPVGNFLESFTTGFGLDFKSGYKTQWLKNNFSVTYGPTNATGSKPKIVCNTLSMKRDTYVLFPIPVPSLQLNLNLSKITSGLALIASSR